MVKMENVILNDRYRVTKKLYDSSIMTAYVGTDAITDNKIMFKFLNPDTLTHYEVDKICFANELGMIKSFDHPNILRTYEAEEYDNTFCVITEYFESEILSSFLSKGNSFDVESSLKIISQLASALGYAYRKGILHRNIKASNICIVKDDSSYVVKLFDFGMSYVIDYMNSTATMNVNASFGYMAPESTGLLDRKVDSRSDLYSLGILLYQFLTGVLPFSADTIDNMVYQHVAVTPKNPKELIPTLPEYACTIAMKLISKDPDTRYQSTSELINDIDRYLCGTLLDTVNSDDNLLHTLDSKSKFIGREREFKKIKSFGKQALNDAGRFCLVHGGLGSGKSDLFTNYCNFLQQSNINYFDVHFIPQNSMSPYFAFQEIIEQYIRLFSKYDHKLQVLERNRLARTLGGLTDVVFRISPEMKKVLPESLRLPTLEGYKEQQRSLMLLSSLFLSLFTADKPYVLCFEDIQYADAASLSLIREMINNITEHKVFIICSYRDDTIDDTPFLDSFLQNLKNQSIPYDEVPLKPLSETYMTEYLSELLKLKKDECKILSTYLVEKTNGNPYFTVNILRSMLEDGVISIHDGTLEQNWDQLHALNDKNDLMQLILRRMERLPEDAISLLEVAAIIGDEFTLNLLMFVTDLKHTDINTWIEQAISLQFIEYSSSRDTMVFAHNQIHEAFLAGIELKRKKELHYWIAKAIEVLAASQVNKEIYRLVYHFSLAEANDDLKRYIMTAADMARLANANDDAIIYYKKTVELIESYGDSSLPEWHKAKRALTELNLTVGHYEDAITISQELLPLMTNVVEKAQLLLYIGRGYFHQSKFDICEQTLIEALKSLGEHFPDSLRIIKTKIKFMRVSLRISDILRIDPLAKPSKGNNVKAKTIATIYETLSWVYGLNNISKFEYVVLYNLGFTCRHIGRSPELGSALSALATYYMLHMKHKLAEDTQRNAINMRHSLNDEFGVARSYFFLGMETMWRGDNRKSIRSFQEAYDMFLKIGDVWELSNIINQMSIARCNLGEYEESIKLCKQNIGICTKINDTFGLCNTYCVLSNCYLEMGSYPIAEEYALRAFSVYKDVSSPYASVITNLTYGKLLIETEKYEKAIHCLEEAKQIYEQYGLLPEYAATVYPYLAIAKARHLIDIKLTLTKTELNAGEADILVLCNKGIKILNNLPNQVITAHRALALYGILTEKYSYTDSSFFLGIEVATKGEHKFETAMIHYECGQYLADKHRVEEARYHTFEAYMTFSGISSMIYIKRCEEIISNKYQDDFSDNTILANASARRNRMNIDRKINSLLKLGERLTSTLELEELQKKILQDAVELVGAERGILFLYPESGEKKLYVASIFNLGNFDFNTYDWMLEEVERNKQTVVINDVQSDEYRRHYTVMVRYGIKSVMAMPMFVRGKMFGVIYLDSRLTRGIFSDEYMETMGFIANQAGAPIENARLYHRAITDGLTGIYGRSYLDNLIIDKIETGGEPILTALMLDVDNFKKCNDTYGHQFGDKVLKQVASVMKRVAGTVGTVCRYGGEEFVVLLDRNDEEYVVNMAERIRQTIQSTTVAFHEGTTVVPVSITVSIGVSIWHSDMERVELIEHADKALYYGKHNGKNQVVLWRPETDEFIKDTK